MRPTQDGDLELAPGLTCRSTGKIAVCGGKVQPDGMFPPQTAIFARKHQNYLANEVIYPANNPAAPFVPI
jgi:hypothetical protein